MYLSQKHFLLFVFHFLKKMLIFPEITVFEMYFRTFVLIHLIKSSNLSRNTTLQIMQPYYQTFVLKNSLFLL